MLVALLRCHRLLVLAVLAASILIAGRLDAQRVQDARQSSVRAESALHLERGEPDPTVLAVGASEGTSVGQHAAWGAAGGLATWLILYTVVIPCDSECRGWTVMILPGFVAAGGAIGALIGLVRTR